RPLLLDRIEHALARAARGSLHPAVLYLDLDQFKAVNDLYGHQAGDQLLMAIAERLRTSVRPADSVARLGRDEFLLLGDDVADRSDVAALAERVLGVIGEPVDIGPATIVVSGSVGVAFPARHDWSAAALLHHGDHAMYAAKRAGGSRWVLSDKARPPL